MHTGIGERNLMSPMMAKMITRPDVSRAGGGRLLARDDGNEQRRSHLGMVGGPDTFSWYLFIAQAEGPG